MHGVASLDRSRYVSLATLRRTGAEVRTPVWFAALDGRLYVFSAGGAGKVKRLRHTSRVRIAACDARGRVRDAWRDATARIVTDAGTIARARAAFVAKYGWQIRVFDFFSWLGGRIRRRAWIEICLDGGPDMAPIPPTFGPSPA
ncbi:MAG: PPOX class F420-dependent oxidoreductase [Candidatus Rokubacteria bacterium]|nr:PPOX class F420-dependent oxidoreductase [Candidatus Rokubacteria bacterium]